jgi:hypothetical protein
MLFLSQKNRHAGNHALNVRPQSRCPRTFLGRRSGLGLEPLIFILSQSSVSMGSNAALGMELAREWHQESV